MSFILRYSGHLNSLIAERLASLYSRGVRKLSEDAAIGNWPVPKEQARGRAFGERRLREVTWRMANLKFRLIPSSAELDPLLPESHWSRQFS